jgi:hypothetical protein
MAADLFIVSSSPMQTASGTVVSALVTSPEKDQRPWVAAQKAAGVIHSGRLSFTTPNGNYILLRSSVQDILNYKILLKFLIQYMKFIFHTN